MNQAILVVSFGSSYEEARNTCIRPVEEAMERAFAPCEVRRAFTSRIIMRRLRDRGIFIDSEGEALAKLEAEGYNDITVVPTHIISGIEYEKICIAAPGRRISAPLLAKDEDMAWMANLLGRIADEEGRTLLVMGHGTEHAANAAYNRLRGYLPKNVFLACVEGSYTLESMMPELEAIEDKRITLMPLMLVAGDHAHNDLAGDRDDSWKSILTKHGFDVNVRMQGLGTLEEVQQKFVEKARVCVK